MRFFGDQHCPHRWSWKHTESEGSTKTTNPKVLLPSWLEILWRTEGVWKMLGMSNHSNCAHVHGTLGHLLCEKDLPNYNPNILTKKDQIIISKNSLPISTFLLVLFSSPRTSSYLMPVKPKWINRCPWCICSRLMSQWIRFADRSGSLETSPQRLGIYENLLPGTLATKKRETHLAIAAVNFISRWIWGWEARCHLHNCSIHFLIGTALESWFACSPKKHHYLTKGQGIHLTIIPLKCPQLEESKSKRLENLYVRNFL